MPDLLTPTERAALHACLTPDARCALLLEWVLVELRKLYACVPAVICPVPPTGDGELHEGQTGPGLPPSINPAFWDAPQREAPTVPVAPRPQPGTGGPVPSSFGDRRKRGRR